MAATRVVRSSRSKLSARGSGKSVGAGKRSASRRPTERRVRSGGGKAALRTTKPVHIELPVAEDPRDKVFLDDPSLDRRIIEGMLHDRTDLMAQMATRGINQGQVLRRAAELGLSEALIRQVRGVAADLAGERPTQKKPAPETLAARTCLCCDRIFLSSGRGNRLCMRCRGGDAGLAQL